MGHELYLNENGTKYAVLVSYGYGAGWSSWSERFLAYDKRVVEFWLAHKNDKQWMREVERYGSGSRQESPAHKEAREFFTNVIGLDRCPYMGGFADIELEWVNFGVAWRIDEYDDAESIVYQYMEEWTLFT